MQRTHTRNKQRKPAQMPITLVPTTEGKSHPLAETIIGTRTTRKTEVEFELSKEKTGIRLTGVSNNGTNYRIIYAGVQKTKLKSKTENPEINRIFRCFILRKNGEEIRTILMSLEGNRVVIGKIDNLDIFMQNNEDGSKTRIVLTLK